MITALAFAVFRRIALLISFSIFGQCYLFLYEMLQAYSAGI